MTRRLALPLLLAAAMAASLSAAAGASAATGPAWRIDAISNTTVAPGGRLNYLLQVTNVGEEAGVLPKLMVNLPEGMTVAPGFEPGSTRLGGCTPEDPSGASSFSCLVLAFFSRHESVKMVLPVAVAQSASGTLISSFEVSEGGAASPASTVDATRVAANPPGFGAAAFDSQLSGEGGSPFTQAGGHPYSFSTTIDFNTEENAGQDQLNPIFGAAYPVEPIKDVFVAQPPGLIGNPDAASKCTAVKLVGANPGFLPRSLCSPSSQVGTTLVRVNGQNALNVLGPLPVYNLVPPPGVPGRFGFNLAGTIVTFDAAVRSGGDYGIVASFRNIVEALPVASTTVTLWGVPADAGHESERGCPGENEPFNAGQSGPTCPSDAPQATAFLRMPTSCPEEGEGLPFAAKLDSWANPGAQNANGTPNLADPNWKSAEFISHKPPAYPYPREDWGEAQGPSGCEAVPFTPSFEAKPTTNAADSPSGLEVDFSVPQKELEEPGAIAQSDLRKTVLTLPAGMAVNPSQADGLGACTSAQIGLIGTNFPAPSPIHFTDEEAHCPDSSKIGSVQIETPLLEEPVQGSVYLAAQKDNPFNSLLALYIVAKGPGVILKSAGRVEADPQTGQLRTVFDNLPQLPFAHLHVGLFGGPRAPLITPPACGTFAAEAAMTPWSGNPAVDQASPFEISKGPSGTACPPKPAPFDPKLSAATKSPLAGAFSPFALRLHREDGTQRLAGVQLTLPPGLTGRLAGIPYCSDAALGSIPTGEGTGAAQLASPACPAASQVGTVTAGAGAGPNPFYVQTGKAYLAAPYKGAPLSLAILTPALAGPFDLGNVLVRTALEVNEETAQITAVSDPLPTILDGIPLDLRDVRVNMDRPGFTLNPTSCDPMAFEGTASGTEGAAANLSERFQVGNCAALGFKPKLSFRLKGKTNRGANPALRATLTMPKGGANIARAAVTLPHSEFLDNAHIGTVCTRVQFAADRCPAKSIYGHARAITPLLEAPLQGPVYLRSSDNELPDLVADLGGQIEVVLDGRIDSVNGGIRNTFEVVPDAPVSKFVLTMQGAKKGLLENSTDLCAATHRASVRFEGQNGKVAESSPALVARCAGKAHKHHRR
jgi:hypothetical protein